MNNNGNSVLVCQQLVKQCQHYSRICVSDEFFRNAITLNPAYRASKTQPAEVLRNE
ncbi:MAG: hypothetical protein P8H39_11325 [Thalassotalea sp.]|nr:hypothetical protein [Thalassotalea sp.]